MNERSHQKDDSGFLHCLYKDPDSNSSEQRYPRLHQWRPLSWNPFDVHDSNEALRVDEEYQHLLEKSPTSPQEESSKIAVTPATTEPNQLLNPGPAWVNLFYDLAWTATFSSLTQNGQFDTVWDTASYTSFFVVVWWLWASQVLYCINFYTDDWFHLGAIFLQLGVFGLLAATTRGYDVTTHILHSPGLELGDLDHKRLDDITDPKRYNDEKTARRSIRVIAFSIAISRVILLIQHLRVLAYAHFTVRSHRGRGYHIPRKLHIIPIGLAISTALFFTAWGITNSEFGATLMGAKLKYVFWGLGLIVEVFSHVRMSRISWHRSQTGRKNRWFWSRESKHSEVAQEDTEITESRAIVLPSPPPELPVPQSDVTLGSRLEAITTIILGEGINGIAGTLYSIIDAPGLEGPIVANIICSGFIVYFLAYLYFEGPSSGHGDSGEKTRHKVYWLLLYLPFLLFIVLLLQGVKNQFLLTSFLSTARKIAKELDMLDQELLERWTEPNLGSDANFTRRLVNYGISWSQEHGWLVGNLTVNSSLASASAPLNEEQREELYIWHWRLSLRVLMKIHELFMGTNKVPDDIQKRIDNYYQNVTEPRQDHDADSEDYGALNYYQILDAVLKHSVQSARYIMVFAGLVFILLGALDLAHSRPRDRFQCGAIISRFLMGWAFLSLAFLNVGKHQTLWVKKGHEHEQAGLFLWISSYWVLPTITLAFGIEYFIETILVWLAALVRERGQTRSRTPLARTAWRSLRRAVTSPFKLFHRRI